MKRRFLFSVLMAGLMAFNFASCKDDDDDDNKGDGKTPQKDVNFVVSTQANEVTITTTLVAEQMWVDVNKQVINFVDGVATINLPIKGEYEATITSLINGETSTSEVFTITIEESDLSFLNKGILKTLTGGADVYSSATPTEKGAFTRNWRIDNFYNGDYEYNKSGYIGGIVFYGNDWQACAGSYAKSWQGANFGEHATIAFDFTNQVAKFTIEDETVVDTTGAALANGDYYTTFTYTLHSEKWDYKNGGGAQIETAINGKLANEYIEISFAPTNINSNSYVRMPIDNIYSQSESIQAQDLLNVVLFTDSTGNVLFSHIIRSWDGDPVGKPDPCGLLYTYVADELDAEYTYSSEDIFVAPDAPEKSATQIEDGVYLLATAPTADYYDWINLSIGNAAGDPASADTYKSNMCSWWCFGNPETTVTDGKPNEHGEARWTAAKAAMDAETIEFAGNSIKVHFAAPKANYWGEVAEGDIQDLDEEDIAVEFTFADGVYKLSGDGIKLYAPNVNIGLKTEWYVLKATDGIFFGFDNVDADNRSYQTAGFYLVKK